MRFLVFNLLLLLAVKTISAQTTSTRNSILEHAVGGASVTCTEHFSALENLSSLPLIDSLVAGITVRNNYFLRELTLTSIGVTYSNNNNGYGIQYTHLGNENYNENKIGIAYGKKLSQNFHLGVKVNLLQVNQTFYGNISFVDVELGLRTMLTENLTFATHLFNPFSFNRKTVTEEEVNINSGLRAGISYTESQFNFLLEAESSSLLPFAVKGGFIWHINSSFNLRAGTSFPNNHVSGGIGLKLKKTEIQFFYKYEVILENSAGLGLNYAI